MSKAKQNPDFYFNTAKKCPSCGSYNYKTKWGSKDPKCNACGHEEE